MAMYMTPLALHSRDPSARKALHTCIEAPPLTTVPNSFFVSPLHDRVCDILGRVRMKCQSLVKWVDQVFVYAYALGMAGEILVSIPEL